MKVVYKVWFGRIGILITEDEFTKERKIRVGIGNGLSEESDTTLIMNTGVTLPTSELGKILAIATQKEVKIG